MAATYVLPPSTDVHKVRLEIGDTDTANAFLQDEEIQYYLTENDDDILKAAIDCATALKNKFALQPESSSMDGMSISYGNLTQRFAAIVTTLEDRKNRKRGGMGVVLTGGSRSGKDAVKSDSDRPADTFTVGMHDNVRDPEAIRLNSVE